MNESLRLSCVVWYEAADYAEIKALMVDGQQLPGTYMRWRLQAMATDERLVAEGDVVFRAVLKPAEFRAYCADHDRAPDAETRDEFAMRAALLAYREGGNVTLYRPAGLP